MISLTTNDNYASLDSVISAWTNNALSIFTTVVSSNVGYRGENAQFTFDISSLTAKQTYINIKINTNFNPLTNNSTTLPIGSTYISPF